MIRRRQFIAGLGSAAAGWPGLAFAQDQAPRIVFNPALGVAQYFQVSYRLREGPATPTGTVEDRFRINYRLTVTPMKL